jgi:hypothetical protein
VDGDEIIVPSRPYSDSAETQQKTLSDVLDELCAYYMLCGVSCDEYWNGDYTKFKYYVEAHRLAVEQRNQEMWMQGFYNLDAFSVALAKAFDKHSTAMYFEEPLRITEMNDIEKEKEKERIANKFRDQLMALTKRMDAKHRTDKQGGEKP